jgi:hypothetical protein
VDAFRAWRLQGGGTPGSLLEGFLASQAGSNYKKDLVQAEGTDTAIARAWISINMVGDYGEQDLQTMKDLRAEFQAVVQGRINCFVWASFFLRCEGWEVMDQLVLMAILSALVAVGFVCCLMLPPTEAFACLICIVFVNLNIMGFVSAWGVQMSPALVAYLVLTLGFSVDYAAHIAEAFSVNLQRPENAGKELGVIMERGLRTTGMSVLHAGTSTVLAVCVLAFSVSRGFRDLFKCFFLMVVFGLLTSMVLLPILLVAFARLMRWSKTEHSVKSDGDIETQGKDGKVMQITLGCPISKGSGEAEEETTIAMDPHGPAVANISEEPSSSPVVVSSPIRLGSRSKELSTITTM